MSKYQNRYYSGDEILAMSKDLDGENVFEAAAVFIICYCCLDKIDKQRVINLLQLQQINVRQLSELLDPAYPSRTLGHEPSDR